MKRLQELIKRPSLHGRGLWRRVGGASLKEEHDEDEDGGGGGGDAITSGQPVTCHL